jgi:predicted nucleic acid-binding protein
VTDISNPDQQILLDTCIIQYLLDSRIFPELNKYIVTLSTQSPHVSQMTKAELLDGCTIANEKRVLEILQTVTSLELTERILLGAGKLGSVYREYSSDLKEISLADKVIAATAIVHSQLILTHNRVHFPHPFFLEVQSTNIVYQARKSKAIVCPVLLAANMPFILERFKRRI